MVVQVQVQLIVFVVAIIIRPSKTKIPVFFGESSHTFDALHARNSPNYLMQVSQQQQVAAQCWELKSWIVVIKSSLFVIPVLKVAVLMR